jgi:CheY-like chemotaxis protein
MMPTSSGNSRSGRVPEVAHHEPRIFAPLLWTLAATSIVRDATHLLVGRGPAAATAAATAGLMTVAAAALIYSGRLAWEWEQRRTARRPRALVVEPREDDARVIERALEGRCEVDWAETVGEARRWLGRHGWPDFVVVALRFPEGSGLEVARLARDHGASGRLVIVTAATDGEDVAEARRLGVRAVLAKPVDGGQLRRVLGLEG